MGYSTVEQWLEEELGLLPRPLPADEVQIMAARLSDSSPVLPRLEGLLSRPESVRRDRFHFPLDRDRFTLARGGLRLLLAHYCRTSPADLVLGYSPEGKPVLDAPANGGGLNFSVSHSGDLVVYAFARERLVGIDLEQVRTMVDEESLVKGYFSAEEASSYRALPEAERTRGFFRGWTRKEAILKALGVGLGGGLDTFTVTLGPDEPARLLKGKPGGIDADRWSLHDLPIDPEYITALAVVGSNIQVQLRGSVATRAAASKSTSRNL
jgi:4'-phosphopantetheinyl transferase